MGHPGHKLERIRALSIIIGGQFCLAIALGGKGMVLLGVFGASVGAGIQQAMQMIGGQGLGFISGECAEYAACHDGKCVSPSPCLSLPRSLWLTATRWRVEKQRSEPSDWYIVIISR